MVPKWTILSVLKCKIPKMFGAALRNPLVGGEGITTPPDFPATIILASRVWLATLVCSANFQAHRQTSIFIPVRFPDGKYLQAEEAAPAGCKHFCRRLSLGYSVVHSENGNTLCGCRIDLATIKCYIFKFFYENRYTCCH